MVFWLHYINTSKIVNKITNFTIKIKFIFAYKENTKTLIRTPLKTLYLLRDTFIYPGLTGAFPHSHFYRGGISTRLNIYISLFLMKYLGEKYSIPILWYIIIFWKLLKILKKVKYKKQNSMGGVNKK